MGNRVYYQTTYGADVDHLKEFARFLDDEHERFPVELHNDLIKIFEEANDAAATKQEEMQQEINELKDRIAELESEEEKIE